MSPQISVNGLDLISFPIVSVSHVKPERWSEEFNLRYEKDMERVLEEGRLNELPIIPEIRWNESQDDLPF